MEEISQRSTHNIIKVKEDSEVLSEKLRTLLNVLESDINSVNRFKQEVNQELKNAEVSVRTVERLKSPIYNSFQNFSLPSP
jgi:hypothetical protein